MEYRSGEKSSRKICICDFSVDFTISDFGKDFSPLLYSICCILDKCPSCNKRLIVALSVPIMSAIHSMVFHALRYKSTMRMTILYKKTPQPPWNVDGRGAAMNAAYIYGLNP